VELVVLTPAELDELRGLPGSFADELERDGKVLYDAQGPG
jgi:hypothetical protein